MTSAEILPEPSGLDSRAMTVNRPEIAPLVAHFFSPVTTK
jgi:hypothetical protein